jgi:hypothetical protein
LSVPAFFAPLTDEDIQAVVEVLKSDWLTCDPILNDLRMVLQNMWVRNMLLQFQMELPHYIYAQWL